MAASPAAAMRPGLARAEDRPDQAHLAFPFERFPAGDHFVEHGAEGEDAARRAPGVSGMGSESTYECADSATKARNHEENQAATT
jgi:hypothetical protein